MRRARNSVRLRLSRYLPDSDRTEDTVIPTEDLRVREDLRGLHRYLVPPRAPRGGCECKRSGTQEVLQALAALMDGGTHRNPPRRSPPLGYQLQDSQGGPPFLSPRNTQPQPIPLTTLQSSEVEAAPRIPIGGTPKAIKHSRHEANPRGLNTGTPVGIIRMHLGAPRIAQGGQGYLGMPRGPPIAKYPLSGASHP